MKVETYLKLLKLPYKTAPGNPLMAPKKKLPYIEDGGSAVADSTSILEHLERKQKTPLDEGMSAEDRARAHLIKRTLEEGLYFVLLWSRWVDDKGWEVTRSTLDFLPAPVRWPMGRFIRRQNASKTWAQGTGRHSRADIFALGQRDIDALAGMLGEQVYFLGDRIRTIDLVAYAFLANILKFELDSPLRDAVRSKPNLVGFVDRVAKRIADGI